MSLKEIKHNGKVYIQDKETDSYLSHIEDDMYSVLVFNDNECVIHPRVSQCYTNIKDVSEGEKSNAIYPSHPSSPFPHS